jgi:FAD-dependent urate hydroxylase
MTPSGADTDVALIGAGPYALSLAAHLSARGVAHEIFGEPMAGWLEHMPEGMSLKSEGCASSLSDPSDEHSLDRFCAEHGIEYGDIGIPVTLDTFTSYGKWFQERLVPDVRRAWVERVQPNSNGFELTLGSGDTLRARRVVIASGLEGCAHVPEALAGLPPEAVSHSYDHADLAPFKGRKVAVIGAGQSALETATLLHERGASVTLVARGPRLLWNGPPRLGPRRLRRRLRYPRSGLGDGKAVFFYARAPLGFHAFPRAQRLKLVYTVLGPAGAWWLRERFEGHVEARVNRSIVAAEPVDGQVRLRLEGADGSEELDTEHVLASTGYRPNVGRQQILEPSLRERIAQVEGAPSLSRSFESSVPGLYFIGYSSAVSFGPVMRFVYGAGFTARRLSRSLVRAAG